MSFNVRGGVAIIKTRLVLAIAVTALLSAALTIVIRDRFFPPDPEIAGPAPDRRTLQSTILGESREYLVHLPHGYGTNPAARFPVLYVLDGLSQSAHSAESAALLARIGAIPPMIVVGVPNVDSGTRNRDLTPPNRWLAARSGGASAGGAERFLSFLSEELIPHIEREYRTARPRMLSGWSRGGLFVLYTQVAAPPLFDARFAHSPFFWLEEDPNVARFEEGLRASAPAETFLYLSIGDREAKETMLPFRKAGRILEQNARPPLRWKMEMSAGGDHNSNARLSTPLGLWATFAPAKPRQ